jgi:hypothetical protein
MDEGVVGESGDRVSAQPHIAAVQAITTAKRCDAFGRMSLPSARNADTSTKHAEWRQ